MNKFLTVLFLLFVFSFSLYGESGYIITLKGGTKIKAESYVKKGDIVKVFKYGGYIIYPLKNIKSIERIREDKDKFRNLYVSSKKKKTKKLDNSSTDKVKKRKPIKECNPIVKKIESLPVYSKEKSGFDLNLRGEINNNCPEYIKNLYIELTYYDENNNVLFSHKEFLDQILPFDTLKFSKKIKCSNVSKIKYFNYKLEFTKEWIIQKQL